MTQGSENSAGGARFSGIKTTSGKALALVVASTLLVMFVTSLLYRLENPSRIVAPREQPRQAMGNGGATMGEADMEAVRGLMQRLAENPDDPEAQLELARRFLAMNAWDRAASFAQSAVNLMPTNPEALNLYGVALFRMERYAESAAILEQLVAVAPSNVMALFNLGVIYKHYLDKPDEGQERLRRALALNPEERVRSMIETELARAPEHLR